MVELQGKLWLCFDAHHECDGQTDRQTQLPQHIPWCDASCSKKEDMTNLVKTVFDIYQFITLYNKQRIVTCE